MHSYCVIIYYHCLILFIYLQVSHYHKCGLQKSTDSVLPYLLWFTLSRAFSTTSQLFKYQVSMNNEQSLALLQAKYFIICKIRFTTFISRCTFISTLLSCEGGNLLTNAIYDINDSVNSLYTAVLLVTVILACSFKVPATHQLGLYGILKGSEICHWHCCTNWRTS